MLFRRCALLLRNETSRCGAGGLFALLAPAEETKPVFQRFLFGQCDHAGPAAPSSTAPVRRCSFSTLVEPLTQPSAAKSSFRDADSILKHVAVQRLRERLELRAQEQQIVSCAELIQLIKEHGIASSEADAAQVVSTLHTAGVVLKHRDAIYLNPEEVTELVIRALPDTAQEAEQHLKELEKQLQPMEQQLRRINAAAQWRANLIAYGGFVILVTQTAFYARLTYWELSWDVIEPIAYFTSQGTVVACYLYYLWTRRDFTYEGHFKAVTSTNRDRLLNQHKFNAALYDKLLKDHSRWQRYLQQASTPQAK